MPETREEIHAATVQQLGVYAEIIEETVDALVELVGESARTVQPATIIRACLTRKKPQRRTTAERAQTPCPVCGGASVRGALCADCAVCGECESGQPPMLCHGVSRTQSRAPLLAGAPQREKVIAGAAVELIAEARETLKLPRGAALSEAVAALATFMREWDGLDCAIDGPYDDASYRAIGEALNTAIHKLRARAALASPAERTGREEG